MTPHDPEYVNRYLAEVKSTTSSRLRELACRYLGREDFTTVVVGKK